MHCPQNLGVAAGHAGGHAALQRLEAAEHSGRLQHAQQEAQHLQPRADVGKVGLVGLFLQRAHTEMQPVGETTHQQVQNKPVDNL